MADVFLLTKRGLIHNTSTVTSFVKTCKPFKSRQFSFIFLIMSIVFHGPPRARRNQRTSLMLVVPPMIVLQGGPLANTKTDVNRNYSAQFYFTVAQMLLM